MDKTSEKVIKDPKRVEILPIQEMKLPALLPVQAMKLPAMLTNTTTIRSNNTYVYGVGILSILAIGVCVFFAYNTFPKKKKQATDRLAAQHEQK